MNFQKIEDIGRGGFGRVEKVKTDDGRILARKIFEPASYIPQDAHDRLRKRFKREVTIQEQLASPTIMPVEFAHLKGDSPWFLMPLAEKTYETQIKEDHLEGSVDIDAIADILNGLEYLHELGYVHRDLNPKNILLVGKTWRLSDFGAVLPPTGHTVTLTGGTAIYTEQYCAPEQKHDFHSAKSPADVFSFGCILHDIFGSPPRTPYSRVTADGPIGHVIEKCTELSPARRPRIKVLRGLVIEQLIEVGGHCKVEDEESAKWLDKLSDIDNWKDDDYERFARFFNNLDVHAREEGHEEEYVSSLSTPFLTRLRATALKNIVARNDGLCDAILEKYCLWAHQTSFLFAFADSIAVRLAAIFDNGRPEQKAMAFAAMIALGSSHNRWYVMRTALKRCDKRELNEKLGHRLRIELITEELVDEFNYCISSAGWDADSVHPELRKLVIEVG